MFRKVLKRGVPVIPGSRQRKYRSIANNLAILHILALFISFSFASFLLYMKLLDHLNQSGIKGLLDEEVSVKTMLQSPNGLELLKNEMEGQRYDMEGHQFYIRLLDLHGRSILETTGMAKSIPSTAFPQPAGNPDVLKWRVPSGKLYLLKGDRLPGNPLIGSGLHLQIGMDIENDERLSRQFLTTLIIFSLGGLAFAVISAIYIVRLGLKPLNDMSATVQQITELHLNTRINPVLLPVEMESLAGSFNSMLGHLESAFRKLAQYSENLAHELRTPINNLMIEADIALSRQRTPEEYRNVISSSMEEFRRLAMLVDRLLFLSRADNQQLKPSLKRIDVLQELESVAEFYLETARDKGVAVSVAGGASLVADPVLFCRAVSNLLANALNYTPEGGYVTLAARQAEDASTEVSVSDTGCGIDPEMLPKIFDRYFWVESTRMKDPQGTGLGLDIVKAIMELHRGSVAIQSEPGKGTTVTLRFPPTPDSGRAL